MISGVHREFPNIFLRMKKNDVEFGRVETDQRHVSAVISVNHYFADFVWFKVADLLVTKNFVKFKISIDYSFLF